MTAYPETDVRMSFVSFVDHLPSDIIRKLWLTQSLDTSYNALKDELKDKIKRLDLDGLPKDQFRVLTKEIVHISNKMSSIRNESLAEARSISASIKIARLRLDNQHKQLEHDHKLYQNEIEMRLNLSKHAQRSNKRTSTGVSRIKLKLNMNTSDTPKIRVARPVSQFEVSKESAAVDKPSRKRGRSRKYTQSTPEVETSAKRKILLKAKQEATKQLAKKQKAAVPEQQSKKEKRAQKIQRNANVIQIEEDEEVYCVCNGPAYGDMVACDNDKCPKEWFHYGCVGLARAPRGKWYCPFCIKKMKKSND